MRKKNKCSTKWIIATFAILAALIGVLVAVGTYLKKKADMIGDTLDYDDDFYGEDDYCCDDDECCCGNGSADCNENSCCCDDECCCADDECDCSDIEPKTDSKPQK